jgi:drug/metabolite transporter (DMT)-like permease
MNINLTIILLVVISVTLLTAAQLLLKTAMNKIGSFDFCVKNLIKIGLQIITNKHFLFGFFCYVTAFGTWLLVLTKINVTIAFPLISISYIFNAIAAHYLLNESLSRQCVIGIFIILFGVILIA